MKFEILKKITAAAVTAAITVTLLSGCKSDKKKPDALPSPTATGVTETVYDDKALNTDYVAKMGDVCLYEPQYYYFLYTALSEAYYVSEEFGKLADDENADKTDEEKLDEFVNFFYKKPEGSEKTNLQIAADRALEICHTFNISALRGKENKLVTQDEIDKLIDEIDEIADKYSDYYKMTRDECMDAMYGMSVNDLKAYSELQSYSKAYADQWKKDNGYVFEEKEPAKPTKPTEPGKDATDTEKDKYEDDLKQYDEDLADYNDAMKAYNDKKTVFWEQFREAYNKGVEAYRIVSVRYLYVSALDGEGEKIDEAAKKAKKAEIESYVKLSTDFGYDFEKVIKGFSDSEDGICDLDIANASDNPFNEEIVLWISKTAKISDEIKIFETPDGYYAVQIVGVTDFDKTEGVVADAEKVASPDKVRETVSYFYLNDLFDKYVKMLAGEEEYKLSDIDYDRMYELAEEYVHDTGEDDSTEPDKK